MGCFVLGKKPHPFDSDEKVFAVKFREKKRNKEVKEINTWSHVASL